MALTNAYLVTTKNLDAFLKSIQSAKAPERFTNKFLTQLDFTSTNDRLLIGVLKALRFLDDNGVPTQRYFDFLDQGQSGRVLAEGIRDAYSDLFNVNKNAQTLTVDEVKNKLKTLTLGQVRQSGVVDGEHLQGAFRSRGLECCTISSHIYCDATSSCHRRETGEQSEDATTASANNCAAEF